MKTSAIILFCAAAVSAFASGLYEEYRPPAEKPVEKVEKPAKVSYAGLHDVTVRFAVGGVKTEDLAKATTATAGVLERRAAGLAKEADVEAGDGGITVTLRGCAEPGRALEILMTPGRLEFQAVADGEAFREFTAAAGWPGERLLPYEHDSLLLVKGEDRAAFRSATEKSLTGGRRLIWGRPTATGGDRAYAVGLATGDGMVVSETIAAAAVTGDLGKARVDFALGPGDGVSFAGLTARHVGESLAVVFDDELLYTARVKEQAQTQVTIFGDLDLAYASVIALLLESGALPVTLNPIEYYVDGKLQNVPGR